MGKRAWVSGRVGLFGTLSLEPHIWLHIWARQGRTWLETEAACGFVSRHCNRGSGSAMLLVCCRSLCFATVLLHHLASLIKGSQISCLEASRSSTAGEQMHQRCFPRTTPNHIKAVHSYTTPASPASPSHRAQYAHHATPACQSPRALPGLPPRHLLAQIPSSSSPSGYSG